MTNHLRYWVCPYTCSATFQSLSEHQDHLRSIHGEKLNDATVLTLGESCAREENSPLLQCPFCNQEKSTRNAWFKHVGHHMEQLALFALPKYLLSHDSDSGSDENMSASDMEDMPVDFLVSDEEAEALDVQDDTLSFNEGPDFNMDISAWHQTPEMSPIHADAEYESAYPLVSQSTSPGPGPGSPSSMEAHIGDRPSNESMDFEKPSSRNLKRAFSESWNNDRDHVTTDMAIPDQVYPHKDTSAELPDRAQRFTDKLPIMRDSLPRKQRTNAAADTRAFTCDRCSKTFTRKSDLTRHHDALHGAGHTYHCDSCAYQSKRQDKMNVRIVLSR